MALTVESDHQPLKFDSTIDFNLSNIKNNYLVVVPEEIVYTTGPQKIKLEIALSVLEEILNSEEFKTKILTYIRNSNAKNEFSRNYLWNNREMPLSNSEIYELLISGDEKTVPNSLGEMNLNIQKYRSSWRKKNVIGYTNPRTSKWIHVNSRQYDHIAVSKMVGNLTHEWIHLLGFLHGKNNIREEVPYVVGRIAGELAKEILDKRYEQ